MFNNITTFVFNFETAEKGILGFVGETQEEAQKYAVMAGWTVLEALGKKEAPAPIHTCRQMTYLEHCQLLDITP